MSEAKLREALKKAGKAAREIQKKTEEADTAEVAASIAEICERSLLFPKRNYSRFDSVADAYKAFREFCRDRQRHPQDGYCAGCVCEKVTTGNCFGTWLYSVAEGGRE